MARTSTGITLYQWEHCPYCVKVRRAFDAMGLEYEIVESPADQSDVYALLGARQVPAIQDARTGACMLESDDIIAYARSTYAPTSRPTNAKLAVVDACPLPPAPQAR